MAEALNDRQIRDDDSLEKFLADEESKLKSTLPDLIEMECDADPIRGDVASLCLRFEDEEMEYLEMDYELVMETDKETNRVSWFIDVPLRYESCSTM